MKPLAEHVVRISTEGRDEVALTRDRIIIGRSEKADFRIDLEEVSREHLEISVEDQTLWVKDLGSTNGTFLGGKALAPHLRFRCGSSAELWVGQRIRIDLRLSQAPDRKALPSESSPQEPRLLDDEVSPPRRSTDGAKDAPAVATPAPLPVDTGVEEEPPSLLEVTELQQLVSELRQELETLENDKIALEEENKKVSRNLARVKSELDETQARRSELTGEITRTEINAAQLSAQLSQLKEEVDKAREGRDQQAREIERWRLESDLERRKARADSEVFQRELELEKGRLQLALRELQSRRDLTERALAVAEAAHSQMAGQTEELRKKSADLAGSLESSQEQLAGLGEAIKAAESAKEKALFETGKVEQGLADLEKELGELETRSQEAHERLRKVQEEARGLEAETARERQKLMDDAHRAAHAELESILNEGRARLEAELKQLRSTDEKERADRKRVFEREREQQLIAVEKEIANRLVAERESSEQRRRQQERERLQKEQMQVESLVQGLERAFGTRLNQEISRSGLDLAILPELLEKIRPVVQETVSPKAAQSDEMNRHLSALDPEGARRARGFWRRAAVATLTTGVVAVLGGLYHQPIKLFLTQHSPFHAEAEDLKALARRTASVAAYTPTTDPEYKATYTDNVLHTTDYLKLKLDSEVQKRWVVELNEFILGDLHLNDRVIVKFISSEANLVRKLSDLRALINPTYEKEGIQRLRSAEESARPELIEAVGGEANYEKLRAFEKTFLERKARESQSTPQSPDAKPNEADTTSASPDRSPSSPAQPLPPQMK